MAVICDHGQAASALSEATWWFKGFSAAVSQDDRGTPANLGERLREIRNWLDRLPYGLHRMLGTNSSALGVVLTEHEFEVLWDALRAPAGEAGDAERKIAMDKLSAILTQFTKERRAFANGSNAEVRF